ncbi:DUF3179 domain-containing protein [Candidatus Woesearchaeota archaeon]|nr:DUF3179 domain-containing protein [Candidatus Woesearchaeota archaeon]
MKYLLLLFSLFAAACTTADDIVGTSQESPPAIGSEEDDAVNVASATEIKTLPDGTKYLIHPDKLRGGGPPKDGIPSIDSPKFVSVAEAGKWLDDDELGAAIIHKNVKRFYPFQILVWHEIVNDVVAGEPVLITYCPLCGSVIGYEGKIDGSPVEFGTSGKLYNSNLVMYDRKTDSYWTQIEGRAIIGPLAGKELKLFPVDVVTWAEWKAANPGSEILSRETGHVRAYGIDPYGDYYASDQTIFPVDRQDERLHPKAVIFGIEVNGAAKAYTEDAVKRKVDFEDAVNGVPVRVTRNESGIVTFMNINTKERIPHEREFWFAWFAFHPDTELFN